VRSIFHHLFFIRIYHEASKPIDKLNIKEREIFRNNPEYVIMFLPSKNKYWIVTINLLLFLKMLRNSSIKSEKCQVTSTKAICIKN